MMHKKQPNIKLKKRRNFVFWSGKLIKTGGHLGRRPYKVPTPRLRHSFIDTFLLGSRDNLMLINTSLTIQQTTRGLLLAAKILRHQGKLLIVDTRGDISPFLDVIEKGLYMIPSVISFSGSRWVGGTVSNLKMISGMVSQYGHISRQFYHFLSENEIQNARYRKMKASYPGLLGKGKGDVMVRLRKKPDLVFVVNPNESRHIIREADALKIPVIALVDSNTNLEGIKIPIPVNYDTTLWVYHCVNTLVRLAHCVQVYEKTGLPLVRPFHLLDKKLFLFGPRQGSEAMFSNKTKVSQLYVSSKKTKESVSRALKEKKKKKTNNKKRKFILLTFKKDKKGMKKETKKRLSFVVAMFSKATTLCYGFK